MRSGPGARASTTEDTTYTEHLKSDLQKEEGRNRRLIQRLARSNTKGWWHMVQAGWQAGCAYRHIREEEEEEEEEDHCWRTREGKKMLSLILSGELHLQKLCRFYVNVVVVVVVGFTSQNHPGLCMHV